MKDSQGRYWCVPCGEADKRLKAITATTANCAGCHKPFPKGKLDKHGEHFFCKACLKKRTKAVGASVAAAPAPAASGSGTASPLSAIINSAAAATTSSAGAAARGGGSGDQRRVVVMSSVLGALVLFWIVVTFVWT